MNFKEMAPKIVEYIGGKENVSAHTHCMTRLRFVLKDDSKVNEEELKKVDGVKGVVKQGGMFQVIIGPNVEQLYNEVAPLLPNSEAKEVVKENTDGKKENPVNKAFAFISGESENKSV